MKKLTELLKEFKSQAYFNGNMKIGQVYSNPYARSFVNEKGEEMQRESELNIEQKQAFLEAVKSYKRYSESIYRNRDLKEVYQSIKNVVEVAQKMTIDETQDWFDGVTVSRHMKRMNESFKVFEKTLKEVSTLQQRLESAYDEIGEVLGKYYEINELEEGNEFGAARAKAIAAGEDSFEVDGKTYKVTGVDKEDKENAKKFVGESVNESDESRELKLYIDNDGQLYRQRFMPILKNLSKKKKKGNYDSKLAIKAFMYLVNDGAKKYVKDYGGSTSMFSKQDKIEVAKEFVEEFEDAYEDKEYDFMESTNESTKLTDILKKKVKSVNEAKYDIGMARRGSGTTVYNRAEEEAGDYKNVAHISDSGNVTFYDKKLPSNIKKQIQAKASKISASTNESEIKVTNMDKVRAREITKKYALRGGYKIPYKVAKRVVGGHSDLSKVKRTLIHGYGLSEDDFSELANLKPGVHKHIYDLFQQKMNESINEAKDIFFDSATEAVNHARKMIEKRGFEIDEDDWQRQIALGGRYGRFRPGKEKSTEATIGLLKNGKPQRKALQISLYGMPSGKYELTYYVN